MSHDELLAVLRPTGIPWAYHHWEDQRDPPYGVYLDGEVNPFFADGQDYFPSMGMMLEIYSLERDPELDRKVQDALKAAEIPYRVHFTWIESEELYETIFEIEV